MKKILLIIISIFFLSILVYTRAYSQQTVYITIDDGPVGGTANLISVTNAQKVPVTFFMVAGQVELSDKNKDLLAQSHASPYITVGNHSYSHAHSHYRHFYSSVTGVIEDMERATTDLGITQRPVLARLPGRDVFRLPGISRNDPFLSHAENSVENRDFDALFKDNFYLFGWDLEWAHQSSGRPIQTVDRLIEQIKLAFENGRTVKKDKLILLMHDEMFRNVFDGRENFNNLIVALKNAGFVIGKLEDYLD